MSSSVVPSLESFAVMRSRAQSPRVLALAPREARTPGTLVRGVVASLASLAVVMVSTAASAETAPSAGASTSSPFVPTAALDLTALSKIVLARSPALQDDLLRLDLARSDVAQSRLWENPAADATWGTIPIGETNPKDLASPLANVPNYSVGLSYRFLLGKRGPRTDRALALEKSARASAEASTRNTALALAAVLGGAATASLRAERLKTLLEESRGSLDVARARVNAGSGTPLEVDRLEIELSRVEEQLLSLESDLASALAICASFVGTPCKAFPSTDEAAAFLRSFTQRAGGASLDVTRRPDVRALDAARDAAQFESSLASAQAIPDPTFRVGYTYDTFTVSGNQASSLALSVSLPLPLVDHGQAQKMAADAKESRVAAQRARLVDSARVRVDGLRNVLARTLKRQQVIETQMLPRARAVLKDLERAVSGRLIPVTDLIQARRTLGELLLQETDALSDAFRASLDLMGELAIGEIAVGDGS